MAYPVYQYPNYTPYYAQPVPDQLAQLRQQQMMQPPVQQPPMMQPGPVDDRIWVQGEGAATSYLVAANGFVRLWDSTAPVFYEKRADAAGKPLAMDIYDYKKRGGEPEAPAQDYENRLAALEKRMAAMEKKRPPAKPDGEEK